MAFFNKIFAYSKKNTTTTTADSQRWNGFEFTDQQVRVILFRECDAQTRKLLFDSTAVKKIEPSSQYPKEKNNNGAEVSDLSSARSSKSDLSICYSNGDQNYQFNRPSADICNLGEMIFGSVALTFRGTCLKIHSIPATEETSKKIMCTHVFWPSPLKSNVTRRPTNSSIVSSTSDLSTTSFKNSYTSGSLEIPRFEYEKDSGFSFGDHSTGSSFSNEGVNLFLSSDQALHDNQFYYPFNSIPVTNRQVFRNLTTSLDFWPPSNRSSISERQSFSDNDSRRNSTTDNDFMKKFKVGLAILIDLNNNREREIFLMEHMPLLDTIMWRLRDCVHRAIYRKQLFFPIMIDGSKEAITSFRLLFQPSIPSAIWYNDFKAAEPSIDNLFYKLFLTSDRRETDADKFIREFCELLKSFDSKDTNFFISSLITAVLSHHLGWIISMANRNSSQSNLCSALWTQLSEMCGAIGTPARSAQTVIVGKSVSNIEPILNIVSYFTRYNAIDRRKEIQIVEEETKARLNPKETFIGETSLEKSLEMTEFKSQSSEDCCNITLEETDFINNSDCDKTNLKRSKTANFEVSEYQKELHLPSSKVLFEIGEDEPLVNLKEKSAEPSCSEKQRSPCHLRVKKYSGVKFNFEQYPQIATNYMKSKNLEMSNIPFLKKTMNDLPIFGEFSNFPESNDQCECGMEKCDEIVLQTPSNASELESTTDIIPEKKQYAIEKVHESVEIRRFDRQKAENTVIVNPDSKSCCTKHTVIIKQTGIKGKKSLKRTEKHPLENCDIKKIDNQNCNPKTIQLKLQTFPLPKSSEVLVKSTFPPAGYEYSLLRTGSTHKQYMPGVVLQAITEPISEWGCALKRDLVLAVHHSPMDQPIAEAVCVLADVDNWRVQIISSSGTSLSTLQGISNSGTPVYSSQLVGDMLESLLELWKLHVAPHECLRHLEEKLFEIYMRSFGFSELLLSTDFCDMNYLTKTLDLHPNDVPLLLAIASTHTPQVVRKYGVTYPT